MGKYKDLLIFFLLLFILTCSLPLLVWGSVVYQGLFFDKSTGTITGIYESREKILIPEIIEGVDVVSIGDYAFAWQYVNPPTTIIIPDSVIKIGDLAFAECRGLTSIKIPDSVRSIGEFAFIHCISLKSINIPSKVTKIGWGVFAYCESLKSIDVSKENTKFSSFEGVLFNKDKTKLIQFPGGFDSNEYLIPDSVTIIGECAFTGCWGLNSIELPDSLTSIGAWAFVHCRGLASIKIPGNVTNIGSEAFAYCESLNSIEVSKENKKFSSFEGVLFNKDKTKLIQFPGGFVSNDYSIPDSVTIIGESAFSYCRGLTSLTIPDSVTIIGESAFSYCRGLTSLTIPDSVTIIGERAFSDCRGLTSLTIPDSVTIIGERAFSNCRGLTSIKIPESVTSIGKDAFSGAVDLIIFTPEGSFAHEYARKEGITYKTLSEIEKREDFLVKAKTYSIEGIDFNMRLAPASTFPTSYVYSHNNDTYYPEDDGGEATVNDDFWVAETPVTYELWYEVRMWAEDNGYTFARAGREGSHGPADDEFTDGTEPSDRKNEPVTRVGWYGSIVWCNAISEMLGYDPVYTIDGEVLRDSQELIDEDLHEDVVAEDRNGFRLPTSREWELAARYKGSDSSHGAIEHPEGSGNYWAPGNYASGATDDYTNEEATKAASWYGENSGGKTQDVGQKPEEGNGLGVYDMSGNVFEWCFSRAPRYVHLGPGRGTYPGLYRVVRVFRGGHFSSSGRSLQVGNFYNLGHFHAESGNWGRGFRLVRTHF